MESPAQFLPGYPWAIHDPAVGHYPGRRPFLIDFGIETACVSLWDTSEQTDCSDGLDNDGDGLIDFPADPGCKSANTQVENPECSDGLDNDSDGLIDLADPQCGLPSGTIEFAPQKSCGLIGIEALPLIGLLVWRRAAAEGGIGVGLTIQIFPPPETRRLRVGRRSEPIRPRLPHAEAPLAGSLEAELAGSPLECLPGRGR